MRGRVVRNRPIGPGPNLASASSESSDVPKLRSRLDGIERPELHAEHFRLGLRFGRHVSADNLVLVVLRGENARHRVVSVAHISLAAAIIFTPPSPRARSPPHESPRTRRVHFTLPSRTITTAPQSASTVARAPSRAHRDRAETPNRSVRSPGPSTPSRPPHRATTASPRASSSSSSSSSHAPSTSP